METMTINSVISLFPETKSQQEIFVSNLIESALLGNMDILKVEAQMANMEAVIKSYRANEKVKEVLLNEAEKYGKSFDLHNAKYEIKQVGVKYDFSQCGISKWNELDEKESAIKEEKKQIEAMLKTMVKKQILVNETTGEAEEIHPPVKTGSTQVVLTIKK